MKIIPILILSIFLSSCVALKKEGPTIDIAKVVRIDPRALEYCSLLKTDVVIDSFDSGLLAYADLAEAYAVCAKQQSDSIKLLKQFGNIP